MSVVDRTPLYQQIAESVRESILYGDLTPGDRLPSLREMAERWGCTPGTVQQAYQELARQGLLTSRPGQGTRVAGALPDVSQQQGPLRRAALVHQAEAFLLQVLAAGYSIGELEQAMRSALDRWRTLVDDSSATSDPGRLHFVGSHDPAVSLIASHFGEIVPGAHLEVTYAGSLGGLMALARGEADMAGCHLWDAESGLYNGPFVQRLLPGRPVALLTLAHRRLGLIVPAGNPMAVIGLRDGLSQGLRFINRQRGSGTRVWLDAQLHLLQLEPATIDGYDDEVATHGETARAVAEGRAQLGLGVETAALELGLGFVPLTRERYDLVIPSQAWDTDAVQALVRWLPSEPARTAIEGLGGYETGETGGVIWVE